MVKGAGQVEVPYTIEFGERNGERFVLVPSLRLFLPLKLRLHSERTLFTPPQRLARPFVALRKRYDRPQRRVAYRDLPPCPTNVRDMDPAQRTGVRGSASRWRVDEDEVGEDVREEFGGEAGDGRQCVPARADQGERDGGRLCMGVELLLSEAYGRQVAEGGSARPGYEGFMRGRRPCISWRAENGVGWKRE